MFWGLVLEPSKKYTQKVNQTFHISQAALDLKSCDQEPIQLLVEYENSNFVLATLSKKSNIYQVPLDLIFKTGDQVSFRTIGNGKVHLSGYHVLEDVDSMLLNGEEESDLEEFEVEDVKGKRKKLTPKGKSSKKPRFDEANEDESDEDDDDLDEEEEDESEEDFALNKSGKKAKKKGSSLLSMDDIDDEDEDDEGDDDDDGDDDEGEEEEEEEEDDDDDDDDDELDEMDFVDSEDEQNKTPKSGSKKAPQTPNGVASVGKGKGKETEKSGQKQKKDKSMMSTPGKTPKSETKWKGEKQKNSEVQSTPQRKGSDGSKNAEKSPKSPKTEGSPQKKVLEGGVISEEIKVGNGPVAKPGKLANVYYIGTLSSTKRQFDSVQNGPGFKFRIGRNEVIKGWDIGINGMKVGGKRKLTIPPHLAYGSKGSPPVIPPNSTLIFTVELRGLS